MLDVARIRAITLDLDDTLWPIEPTIRRAESTLQAWLSQHAPATAALAAQVATKKAASAEKASALREQLKTSTEAPALHHLIASWRSAHEVNS